MVSDSDDKFQWFQVDFGRFIKVTGVATQGRQDHAWWVKTYSLSFSYKGIFFKDYKENEITKVSGMGNNLGKLTACHDV